MKYKSKEASVENIKRMFAATPDEDVISLEQACTSWGRSDGKNNKAWISNKLTDLKYHKLITPIYKFNEGRKKLDKIQLTLEGKKALGRLDPTQFNREKLEHSGKTYSIADVMSIVAELKKDNPAYEINFNVKLKEE